MTANATPQSSHAGIGAHYRHFTCSGPPSSSYSACASALDLYLALCHHSEDGAW